MAPSRTKPPKPRLPSLADAGKAAEYAVEQECRLQPLIGMRATRRPPTAPLRPAVRVRHRQAEIATGLLRIAADSSSRLLDRVVTCSGVWPSAGTGSRCPGGSRIMGPGPARTRALPAVPGTGLGRSSCRRRSRICPRRWWPMRACAVVFRCGPPIRESGRSWPASGSLGGSCRCGTTAAWMCSWRHSAGPKPATCWSSTTAAAWTRPASATWRYWRPGPPGWQAWWCGACTATRRNSPRSAFRSSATAATRPGRCGWRSASQRRWSPRGSGRTWSAPGTSPSPMTTACCSSPQSTPSRCWSPRTRSGRPSGTRPAGSRKGRHCASRPLSMTTWPGAPLTRHTPSGSICAASAGPSKKGAARFE